MKKIKLLMFAALVAGAANAQYFQHDYGTATSQDFLEGGINLFPTTAPGHIMVGYNNSLQFNSLMVTRTNLTGAVLFNNRYAILENAAQRDAKGRSIVQANGRFSIWGDFGTTPGGLSTKFFYGQMGPGGVLAPVVAYQMPFPVVEVEATAITPSTTLANTVFACGFIRQVAGGPRKPIIMSLNTNTGAINWSAQYDIVNIPGIDWTAMDLVQSPYLPSTGIPDIALTGHFIRPGMPEDGCFFLVSTPNGAPTGVGVFSYGTNTDNEAFNSLDIANNPFGSGPGFVLGGYAFNNTNATNDAWGLKISPTGAAVSFSTKLDYAMPNTNSYCNDIMERFSPVTGLYEYYLGGYVDFGLFGGNDDVVYKLNAAGAGMPGGQITFGGPGDERAMQLAKYDGINPNLTDGLSTFGTTIGSFPGLGQTDFYFVKSYFNGVTACNFNFQDPPWMDGPGITEVWQPTVPAKLVQSPLTASSVALQDFQICFTNVGIPGGSNARIGNSSGTAQQLLEPGYFPNPVSHDNAVVTVTFGKEAIGGDAELELWNSLGQLCWSKKTAVSEGQTQMNVELGNALNSGMYHLIIKQNGTVNNYRIVVQ